MRFISNIIFLAFIIVLSSYHLSYADWCSGWVKGSDDIGVRESCESGLPTVNERLKLSRINTDPFNTVYKVYYGYCWFAWFGDCVGGWLEDNATYHQNDLYQASNNNWGGTNRQAGAAPVGLYFYNPGEIYRHNNQPNPKQQPVVCAYYCQPGGGACDPWFSWSYSLIGCVDAPTLPGPPTFNPTLIAGSSPVVDTSIGLEDSLDSNGNIVKGYISLGSAFDQPIIRINQLNGSGQNDSTLTLRYKFPGDTTQYDSYPTCGQLSNSANKITYCAYVSEDNPSQVCACEQDKCSQQEYIGCVARPTPRQSNYGIVVEYKAYTDSVSNQSSPALNYYIVHLTGDGKIKYLDSKGAVVADDGNGNKYILDNDNLTSTPAQGATKFYKLALSPDFQGNNPPSPLKEYYIKTDNSSGQTVNSYLLDTSPSIYGVKFSTFIPKFDDNNLYTSVQILTPKMNFDLNGCEYCRQVQGVNYPTYMYPSGKRIRDVCYSNNIIKSFTPCSNTSNSGSNMSSPDCKAEFAYCPGVYDGPIDPAKPDKICLIQAGSSASTSEWKFIDSKDQVCATIELSYPTQTGNYCNTNNQFTTPGA